MSCLAEIPALLCFGFVLLSFASTGDTQNSTSPTESTSSTKSTSLTTAKDAEIKPKCVFCTYNNAGDGTIDYACVSDPFSHASSRNMTCNFTSHSCIIRVVYEYLDFKKIQSLVRGCEPTKNQSYECDKYVPPTCLRECRSNFCNSIFGDIKNPSPSTLTNNGDTQNYTSPKESTSSTKSATSQESTSPTTAKADIKTECVACVYTYAANGTTDYSCVSDPFSHALSRNVTCNFTSQSCIITILYDTPDSEHIRSMERKCDFTKNQSNECDPYTPSTCLSECRTNFCNTYSVVTRNLTSFSTSTKSTASTQYTPPPTTGKADIKPKCVACTYNNAGDGTVDYACVSDPFSHVTSRNLTCDFTSNSCIIRVVYTSPDFKQIRSLVRGCEPTKYQKDKCDAYDPPTCLLECRSNFCNSIFGDIQNPPVTNGGIRLAFFGLLFVCLGLQHGL